MSKSSFTVAFVLVCFFDALCANERFDIAYRLFNCSVNDDIVTRVKCEINKRSQTLHVNVTFRQDMSNMKVHTLLKISRLNLPRRHDELQTLIDAEVDMCKMFDTSGRGVVIRVLMQATVKDLNVPKTCPFPKNKAIVMNNIDVTENMPPLIPEMDFFAYLKFYMPRQPPFHNVTIIGRLTHKKRKFF